MDLDLSSLLEPGASLDPPVKYRSYMPILLDFCKSLGHLLGLIKGYPGGA